MIRRRLSRLRCDERGAVSPPLEMILIVGLLLIPAMAGLAQLPRWIDARSTADLAAQEAARQVVLATDFADGVAQGDQIAEQIILNHGFDASTLVSVAYSLDPPVPAATLTRGGTVTATVTVAIPSFFVPGVGTVGGAFNLSRSASERVDDYRSFTP